MGQSALQYADITIETDNHPLETIFKKPLYKALRCLQVICMGLQRRSFLVSYKKGAHQVIVDTLSRDPQP